MDVLTVNLDLPRNLIGTLNVPEDQLVSRIKELIALELFREAKISSGKGAELLGISKVEFIRLLARYDVPYFRQSPEELASEVDMLDSLSGKDDP